MDRNERGRPITPTSPQRHPDVGEATTQTLLTPPGHLENEPKWYRTPLMMCVASLGKPGQLPQMRSSCLEASEASSGSSITQKIIDVVFPVGISNEVCEARQLRALWGKPQHADASGPG